MTSRRVENGFLASSGPSSEATATEIAKTFPKAIGLALVEHGTRCGAPGCRCSRGELHPTAYLRWRAGGTQRRKYVRRGELEEVRAVLLSRRLDREAFKADLMEARELFSALIRLERLQQQALREKGGR